MKKLLEVMEKSSIFTVVMVFSGIYIHQKPHKLYTLNMCNLLYKIYVKKKKKLRLTESK